MLEILLKKLEKSLQKKWKKAYLLAIFSWNLVIYSIPLALLSYRILEIPKEILIIFAKEIGEILNYIGIEVLRIENTIIIKNFQFIISQDCIGYKSILGFFAILFATPYIKYKEKIIYFFKVLPLLFALNIIRILSTILLYYYFNINPHFTHNILWGIFTSAVVVISWYLFFRKYKKNIYERLYKT